jgi:hypothetical protein
MGGCPDLHTVAQKQRLQNIRRPRLLAPVIATLKHQIPLTERQFIPATAMGKGIRYRSQRQ